MATWIAYHGKSGAFHQGQCDTIGQSGYRIISLSVTGKPHRVYAATWVKASGPRQRWFHGRTADEYQGIFDTWTKEGYRPTIITATGFGPAIYAGVFEKSPTPFLARHGIGRSAFFDTNQSAEKNGFILRWAAVYGEVTEHGGIFDVPTFEDNTLYAGIWEPNAAQVSWQTSFVDLGDEFQRNFLRNTEDGYRLAFVTITGRQPGAHKIVTGHHYLGVFRKDSIGPWVAHHGLTSDEYQNKVGDHKKNGFLPIVVQAHGQVTNIRYAAIFAQGVP